MRAPTIAIVFVLLAVTAGPARAQQPLPPAASGAVTRAEELERRISESLRADPTLKLQHIEVSVDSSMMATLRGRVSSDADRDRAVRLARIEGISVVRDQLEVGSAGVKDSVTDAAITTKLKAQYLADETLRRSVIAVTTNNGVVTLEGVVPTRTAKARAVDLAARSKGVARVEDRLMLSPPP
jgi:osmotically-inducible protein OsmY